MTISMSRERLAQLLERAQGKRIVVIGDAMLDVYLTGDVERISPEAPVPVVRVRDRKHALGGAANVAQNILAIGCECTLVAAIGSDSGGETLRGMLTQKGGNTDALVGVGRSTTQKTRIVARSQQVVRIDEEEDEDLDGPELERLLEVAREAIETADAVVLEDYNKGVLVPRVIRTTLDHATARGTPVIVDPKYRNFFQYAGATIFKPNQRELEAAIGASISANDPAALSQVVERLGVEHLLLTLGEHGMALVGRAGETTRIPTVAREVYDVVGAGDTVSAYLAAMLAVGARVDEAAVIANLAAGIEVGKFGAATVTAGEMLEYSDTHDLYV